MPLPQTLTTRQVKGRLVRLKTDPNTGDPTLVACVGSVAFTPTPHRIDTTGLVVLPDPVHVAIDAGDDGRFAVELPTTDNSTLSQTDWTWRASFALDATEMDTFHFPLPTESGQPIDITEVTPLAMTGGTADLRGTTPPVTVAGWEPVAAGAAEVINQGDATDVKLYFKLPTGGKGDPGEEGPPGLGATGYFAQFLLGGM